MVSSASVVIDANIVAQLSRELSGQSVTCSAPPAQVFDEIATQGTRVVLDDGDQILSEWQNCVSFEWFEAWFLTFASQANVQQISVGGCQILIAKLQGSCGFPGQSRDKWLVRTSVSEAAATGECLLLTEDMDFYEPSMKSSNKRSAYMTGKLVGKVQRELKKHDVHVMPVDGY